MSHRLNKKTAVMALIGGVLIAATYAFSPAPVPVQQKDHENNLQVLPKDISHDELMQVMHSYEVALNLGCEDCHAPSATEPGKLDFSADSKKKAIALDMMKMVQEMNTTYFDVKGDFKENYLTSAFKVTCITCHNGHAKPADRISIPIPKDWPGK